MWKHPVEIADNSLKPSARAALEKVTPVRVAMGEKVIHSLPQLLSDFGWATQLVLVCDNNTWSAAGKQVSELLSPHAEITLANLGSNPQATMAFVEYIAAAVEETGSTGIIGVGSGTINDLCKLAVARTRRPYIAVATAPSMNGYLSANAAIMRRGHKQSVPAAMPTAAVFDLDVLAAAPKQMIQAGFGDSICRSTAQADWLLSHFLLETAYDETPFALLAPYEDALFAQATGMVRGDTDAIRTLTLTLLFSGLGMVMAGGSYPASQGEHLMAHYLEMTRHDKMKDILHGQQIAVTTLHMATIQQRMLAQQRPPSLRPLTISGYDFQQHFGIETGAEAWSAVQGKVDVWRNAWKLNNKVAVKWQEIRAELARVMRPLDALEAALLACGAPTKARDIGLEGADLEDARLHAHWIRDRYTFLDCAAMSGEA